MEKFGEFSNLVSAVLLRAVKDAKEPGELGNEARRWLQSEEALPYFCLANIDQGRAVLKIQKCIQEPSRNNQLIRGAKNG